MASNPFLTSPFSISGQPTTASDFEDTQQEAVSTPAPIARRAAPTRDDVIVRARQLGVDPSLALSFFGQESSGNWNSKDSPKGARGGFQVMPGTYRSMMGTEDGQRDPWNNMEAGLRYIAYGQKTLGTKDPELLAAGYHAGYDRKDLKSGVIPNTSDGMITTRDYARSVADRVRKARGAGESTPASIDDQFSDTLEDATAPSAKPSANDFTDSFEEATKSAPSMTDAKDAATPAEPSYLDRLTSETKAGFGDMTRSLETARWALGSSDSTALAEQMAKSFQQQAAQKKNKDQQEIDAAYQDVTNAKGAVDTTVAGAKALWASLTHPKETSIEIARNAANSLPTIAGGFGGAGAGAAVGAGVGAAGAGVGAIPGAIAGAAWGGRTGMAIGTTATELGGEIQDMVQNRLSSENLAPTAQNILAVLNEKGFREAARDQGLKKGLTVAAVDQLFLGLGGKVATAPAKKIALKELEDQGADIASRAARNAALASPAGQAALEAAKPSIGAKVASHAAAVGVDAAGESIGEGASQYVSRGNVDYGDALREGVVSIGQSGAEVMAGKTLESAKWAAQDNSKGARFGRELQQIVDQADLNKQPPAGPIGRAIDRAASTPERVTVTAPDGEISGVVTNQAPGAVEVIGDDGEVYHFSTGADGVKITPEAPNAPLSNALEAAAADHASEKAAIHEPAAVIEPATVVPAPQETTPVDLPDVSGRSLEQLRYMAEHGKPGFKEAAVAELAKRAQSPAEAEATTAAPAAPDIEPVKPIAKTETSIADMSDEELRARLKYIADQAKAGNGGWNQMLVKARRAVEKEINSRAKPAEPVSQAALDLTAPVTQATPDQQATATLPKELAGAKPRYSYGNKQFELKFASDFDRAAYIAAQEKPSARDADYLAFAVKHSGLSEEQVRAHGAQVREAIKAMAKDANPGTLKVPEVARGSVTIEKTAAPSAETVAPGETVSAPAEEKVTQPAPIVGTTEEGVGSARPTQAAPVTEATRDAYAGKWFGSRDKAEAFIAKKKAGETHEVVQTGKVRFEIKPKQPVQNEAKAAPAGSAQQSTQGVDHGQGQEGRRQEVLNAEGATEQSAAPSPASEKEQSNVADTRAERKPAGAEEVGQEANAGQAEAAAVQPAASEEVAQPTLAERRKAAKQAPANENASSDPFANNKVFTSDAVAKARARLKSKLNQLNSGFDPELAMDGMVIAGAYIESGVRSFADYAKAMIDDLGPKVRPFLLSFYESARNYPGLNTEGMTDVAQAKTEFDALATKAEDHPNTETQGNDNGPQELDQSGARELEGKQPDAVQGSEPQRQTRPGVEGRRGENARGDERLGSAGVQQSGSLGNDAGEVSAPAAGEGSGRGLQPRRGAVQRSERIAERDSADAGGQRELEPTDGTRAQDRADDFVITDEDAIGEGGSKTKFKQNVAAIRLLKQLQEENRQATRAEQAVLAKYVGWGGLPQAFYRDNGEVSKGWEKEAAELKGLMSEDELSAAAASTRNAHYTSPEIVESLWKAVKHFGFQGGRVLEPSVGVGNFFGLMPTPLRSASQLTGVELDHITGGIAKQLYPQANIQAPVGFQDFSAPDNYFDIAIGNPPFGREGIYDPTRRKISGFSIHNYFFAKSIDTVRPNGVLAMVVTNRLLDSAGDKARAYIADRAEFLGAIRLPNNAFLKNAGTEVTTDIIFLRKLKDGEQPTGERWMDVKQVKDANGATVPLNEYFVRHPEMMLGEFGAYGSMYSPTDPALVAREGQDTPSLLKEAIARLPAGFMDGPTAEPVRETIEPMHDVSHVKVGSIFEQGGQIFERKEDMLGKQQAVPVTFTSEKAKERVTGMVKVRDALIEVRRLQLTEGVNEAKLEAARADLNAAYDDFVKANGPLNSDANKRLMRDDPTWPQLAALEDAFDKGISPAVAKATGEKARPPSAKKAAIFFKRTQSPYRAPESAKSATDALVSSLAERGRVDLDYMASLYAGHTPEAIAKELAGLIYRNPVGGWESREQYLSGNVKKKLAQAIEAAKADPSYKDNVEALKAVQPSDVEAVDIDVKVGSHWIPADVMESFIGHVTSGQRIKAIYNPITATWTINAEGVPQSAATQWGTDRANVLKVLEAAANQKQISIFDEDRISGTRTLNEAATTAANEKVERVKSEWRNWIWADDSRRERLSRIYNDTFNTDVQRDYDGSHLKFPGKVGDDIIQLRPHQANAVWRMVQSDTTLLDHVVGAGKTFTVIAGVMEMRRMGLAKKPMLAVPNHLVGQWAEDFIKLYPGANILAATKKDFEKDSRKRLFARIATGDWDAVIVAHSSFGKVEVEPEFQESFVKQQIADMNTSIEAMRAAEGKSSRNVKQIEKQKAALEEKLKKLFDTGSKDDNLYFGELGIDALFVDEAHEFKNLGFSTGMQRVAGLGNPTGSNKAADMFMKAQAVLKRTGGRNVVFATGTPISNTMAEMYTMQRYLDYATLKDQGIAHFDAWAKTFGEVVTDWELSPSGQYKMNSRFAKFVNMPELMQRYGSFADVINRDDINRQLAAQGKSLPVPKVATGKPENVVVERSRDQAAYIGVPTVDENGQEHYPEGSLVWRAENLPKKAEKGADNMLKIMSDARKAALDMRLIDPSYPDNPGSKVNVAAQNIKALYDQHDQDKGTQLVFIDLSTPKGAKAKEAAALRELVKLADEGDEAAQEKLDAMSPDELMALDGDFSVYDDLKAKLIGLGIPENEIAFIHDANTELQKEDLFGKVRSGRVRVLLGSTAKMGAGMNVQDRLVALHHLDAPWRPSDLEQREGRIIRQGNKLAFDENGKPRPGFEVRILRYATKQTLDSRMWQTIEAKARFIEQVRKGAGEREVEDIGSEAANSAEMKAASSGNPLILEEMSLRQAIRKLETQQSEHAREQHRIRDSIRWKGQQAERSDAEAAVLEKDDPKVPKEFVVKIGNQAFDKHKEAGEAILAAVDAMHKAGEDSREIGNYGDFSLTVDDTSMGKDARAVLTIKGAGEYQIEANPGSSATGLALRMQNTVKDIPNEAKSARQDAANARAEIPKLEAQIKPWGHEQELADAKARHMAVIDQLRPKKKEQAKPDAETPAMSRSSVEAIFEGLDGRGLTRKRALDTLASHPEANKIRYIAENFWDILSELEDSNLVEIKC